MEVGNRSRSGSPKHCRQIRHDVRTDYQPTGEDRQVTAFEEAAEEAGSTMVAHFLGAMPPAPQLVSAPSFMSHAWPSGFSFIIISFVA